MHRRNALSRAIFAAVIAALLAGFLALIGPTGPAGAEETPEPDVGSPDDETPEAIPAGAATPATEANVTTEAQYRAAIINLSADNTSPHTLNINASFVMDDGGNPDYDNDVDQPLTINGNGNTVDMDGESAFLNLFSNGAVIINDLTLTNGRENGDGGALDIVANNIDVTLNNVTFINNFADSDGGAIDFDGEGGTLTINGGLFQLNESDGGGGAIQMDGAAQTLTTNGTTFDRNLAPGGEGGAINDNGEGDNTIDINGSTFTGNRAPNGDGGAVDFSEDFTATGSTFTGNEAGGDGGGVDESDDQGSLVVTDSLFSGNTTESTDMEYAAGGGISLQPDGDFEIDGTTFAGNTAEEGGGFDIHGDGSITNSTFTGNTAEEGGALYTGNDETPDSFSLTYVTIADNTAPEGASIFLDEDVDAFTTFGTNITGPLGGGTNCELNDGTVTSTGFNFSDDDTCELNEGTDTENGGDPQLEALGDFGGPTPTRPPALSSPLVDAIPEADCGPINVDQRNVPRPQDADLDGTLACDIGAVELLTEAPTPADQGPVAAAPGFTG